MTAATVIAVVQGAPVEQRAAHAGAAATQPPGTTAADVAEVAPVNPHLDSRGARAARARKRAADVARATRSAQRNPRPIARRLAGERYGWAGGQFGCLNLLWTRESGWRYTADNPSSSAYGIPQALPGSKMATAGPRWRTNPVTQISWGLAYVKRNYGTPCAAWGHETAAGWY